MPFGIESLNFVDDIISSAGNALDDLFTSDEERKKAQKELEKVKKRLKLGVKEHTRKVLQIHAKDRQDARDAQEVALQKAWWAMPLLMVLSFLGFFGVLGALIFIETQVVAKEPLYIMLGTLGTIVTQIAQFLWGSSAGSKGKDTQIRRLLEKSDIRSAPTGGSAAAPKKKSAKRSIDVPQKIEPLPPESGSGSERIGW
jgi:hypothetical protein